MVTVQQKRAALDEIATANNGRLTADLVVQAARNKDHVLHPCFEWNVAAAAQEHWLDVAGEIIRQVKIEWTIENRVVGAVAYARDPSLPKNEAGYIALSTVERKSAQAMAIVAAELEQRIIPAIERAQALADYLELRRDFDVLLANAVALLTKVERKAEPARRVGPRDLAARAAARRNAGTTKPKHA